MLITLNITIVYVLYIFITNNGVKGSIYTFLFLFLSAGNLFLVLFLRRSLWRNRLEAGSDLSVNVYKLGGLKCGPEHRSKEPDKC